MQYVVCIAKSGRAIKSFKPIYHPDDWEIYKEARCRSNSDYEHRELDSALLEQYAIDKGLNKWEVSMYCHYKHRFHKFKKSEVEQYNAINNLRNNVSMIKESFGFVSNIQQLIESRII